MTAPRANAAIDQNWKPTLIGVSSADGKTPVAVEVDPNTGGLLVSNGLLPGISYDYIDGQQTSTTIDTFVYKLGGSGGTVVRTIVVTYVDSTKADIDTVSYS